jgi:predicted O-methyltransferase YrrM/uncharacterized glyoxalase superfamily protein PhnB
MNAEIAPFLSVRRGAAAVEFYKQAFGATELHRIESPDGAVVCQLSVRGATFWVSDESPAHANFSPESLGGGTARMILIVSDPDAAFAEAVTAGAKPVTPVTNAHGWRVGRVVDPYGHHWEIGRPLDKGPINQNRWAAVEEYFAGLLFPPDAALDAALADSVAAGLPPINVSAAQGRLLALFIRMTHARRVLEIGTLGGYSGIWLARALPTGGRLVTLEIDPRHAEVARRNFDRAGLSDRIDLRVGPAQDTLPAIESEGGGPFDFIFVDADKPRYVEYLDWSIRLSRPGGLIIVDNIVRDGEVVNEHSTDAKVQGVRQFNIALAAERRVEATAIQLVGGKGYDGFAVMVVKRT